MILVSRNMVPLVVVVVVIVVCVSLRNSDTERERERENGGQRRNVNTKLPKLYKTLLS
jgi:hypothetical protein